jgi:hypothetical protein
MKAGLEARELLVLLQAEATSCFSSNALGRLL